MSLQPDPAARLRVDDFDYDLPEGAIAQVPAEARDAARLMVLDRSRSASGRPSLEHRTFSELGALLRPGDLLVVNDSRVIPARLTATLPGGGAAEVLALRVLDEPNRWEALVRPSRRLAVGSRLMLRGGDGVEVGERLDGGTRGVTFFRDPALVMAAARFRGGSDRRTPLHRAPPRRAPSDRHCPGQRDAARGARYLPAAGGRVHRRAPDPPRVVRGAAGDGGSRCRDQAGWRPRGGRGYDKPARPRNGRTDRSRPGLDGPVRHAAV